MPIYASKTRNVPISKLILYSTVAILYCSKERYGPNSVHVIYKNIVDEHNNKGRAKRIWYLSPMRATKVQASLRIRAVSPEPPLLAHTSSDKRGTFRRKARSLAPLNGWACAVKSCHDGMLEDTNSLDLAHNMIHAEDTGPFTHRASERCSNATN